MSFFDGVFLAGFATMMVIRRWFVWTNRRKPVATRRVGVRERMLLAGASVGMAVLPVFVIYTALFRFADYQPLAWQGWLGTALAIPALVLFWKAHADLGANWSPTLELREQHTLTTHGVYRRVRHPMYAAIWLWTVCQFLLIANWVGGLSGIVSFALLYFLRVPREEQMMRDRFGAAYDDYVKKTGRLFPQM